MDVSVPKLDLLNVYLGGELFVLLLGRGALVATDAVHGDEEGEEENEHHVLHVPRPGQAVSEQHHVHCLHPGSTSLITWSGAEEEAGEEESEENVANGTSDFPFSLPQRAEAIP